MYCSWNSRLKAVWLLPSFVALLKDPHCGLDSQVSQFILGRACTPQLLQILADVADAMAYLHPDIVHRDLKSQNGVQQGAHG